MTCPRPKPYAISVITYGENTAIAAKVLRAAGGMGIQMEVFDVRSSLSDPRDTGSRTLQHVDGTHVWTQRAVYSQTAFPGVVADIVTRAEANCFHGEPEDRLIFIKCATGFHRADTTGRTVVSACNRISNVVNGEEVRLFNALHFPLCAVLPRDVQRHIELAFDWVLEPHTVVKGGFTPYRCELYAFDAAQSRRQAMESFEQIYTWTDGFVPLVENDAIADAEVTAAKFDQYALVPHPPREAPMPSRKRKKMETIVRFASSRQHCTMAFKPTVFIIITLPNRQSAE
jgi:hypothetical protein